MSNTKNTNSLNNLVNDLKEDDRVLELIIAKNSFGANVELTMLDDAIPAGGYIRLEETASDGDIVIITLNGKLGGKGVDTFFPAKNSLTATPENDGDK